MWEKPDVPGSNLEGLHYVKNIRPAMEFDKHLNFPEDGRRRRLHPLGVEMAGNVAHRGLRGDLVDEGPWVLSELADPDAAAPAQEALEEARR